MSKKAIKYFSLTTINTSIYIYLHFDSYPLLNLYNFIFFRIKEVANLLQKLNIDSVLIILYL